MCCRSGDRQFARYPSMKAGRVYWRLEAMLCALNMESICVVLLYTLGVLEMMHCVLLCIRGIVESISIC